MAQREHTYNSGRIRRAHTIPGLDTSAVRKRMLEMEYEKEFEDKNVKIRKRRRRWPVVLVVFLVIFSLGAAGAGALYVYLNNVFEPGLPGTIAAENHTPEEYKGDVINLLIVGIDNEEGRGYGSGLGQTDMILYANYNLRDGQLNLLQIPRDSYVGEISGSNGKINSLMISGSDKDNPINNLVNCISTQYKLPVDHYIALDMDGMKDIINVFPGGLYVYVPRDMQYDGSYLGAGWRWLDGDAAEFFVRNRHGQGFERSDIDRLDNQRHFYSALFRRFMNLTPGDVMKLMPVFEYYCSTDMGLKAVGQLGVSGLKLDASKVMFCKVPGATDVSLDPAGAERDFFFVDVYGRGTEEEPGIAALLNKYFRTFGEQVPAEELGFPQINIPSTVALYSPNIQFMGAVQEGEGGAEINVEPNG